MRLTVQEKQLTVFITNNKFWAFEWKLEFGNLVPSTVSLATQTLNFFEAIGSDISKCEYFIFYTMSKFGIFV